MAKDTTITRFPGTAITPGVLLRQLLEQEEAIESLVVGIHSTQDNFLVFHSAAQLKELVTNGKIIDSYINGLVQEYIDSTSTPPE